MEATTRRAALLGVLLTIGCSGSSGGDGGTTGLGSSDCSSTCAGCCDAAGCEVGTATSACGVGGAVCADCGSSSNTCTPSAPQPCECIGGCWDAILAACKTGNTDADCGATFPTNVGTTCQACRAGKHCTLQNQGDGQVYVCQ